ncbi:putative nucleotidyltransferase substrate binding domain-containing protein [Paludibacterium paludis]|uniref:Cyclic nucleotide-binding domain-containing protein n=1 Tax=Paludibacterium paludis TaxID=1225769 RepID=A0A918P5N3_9NEIS|nr:putative nucleotidyltransferase substrate binding domain-containing protein [Paludibacterium paludis]GGY24148.1 hypothetical protein GCM10011289_29860 [Paludibacterium paludis]
MAAFELSHPPFDMLSFPEREALAAAADIFYFADDEEILAPGREVDTLYVVVKGKVREMAGDEVVAMYRQHDTFDARAMVAGSALHRYVVHEEVLALGLPKRDVLALTGSNPAFGAFFFDNVANKLGALARRTGSRELQTMLAASVSDVAMGKPVWVEAGDSVIAVAAAMKRHKVKSVLVRGLSGTGIFTTSDFRDVIIDGIPSGTPVGDLCRYDLITVEDSDFLFNALLTMTRRNIQRLVVTRSGSVSGVLEQVDLLSYFSNHSHLISQVLDRAESLDDLAHSSRQIGRLVGILSSQGVKAPQLARLVETLNAKLFERTWRLIADPALYNNSCLLVMGSEGRGEQILKTDQDNALILGEDADPVEAERAAATFSETLAAYGYPPCPGGIMVCNPQWRLGEDDFARRIAHWTGQPDGESLMNLAIFVDAQAIAGDDRLFVRLRERLAARLADDDAFYARFARAIEQFDTPLGLFAHLVTRERDGKSQLDLKKGGIFPVVHGLRALALEQGLPETNSFERLSRLVEAGRLDREFGNDLSEALSFMMGLKLTCGLAAQEAGGQAGNLVEPETLSSLERDLLKEALSVVKRFKGLLRHHFRLGGFA